MKNKNCNSHSESCRYIDENLLMDVFKVADLYIPKEETICQE